jgi:hypothetical protein
VAELVEEGADRAVEGRSYAPIPNLTALEGNSGG